jgi:hypothetical protein
MNVIQQNHKDRELGCKEQQSFGGCYATSLSNVYLPCLSAECLQRNHGEAPESDFHHRHVAYRTAAQPGKACDVRAADSGKLRISMGKPGSP